MANETKQLGYFKKSEPPKASPTVSTVQKPEPDKPWTDDEARRYGEIPAHLCEPRPSGAEGAESGDPLCCIHGNYHRSYCAKCDAEFRAEEAAPRMNEPKPDLPPKDYVMTAFRSPPFDIEKAVAARLKIVREVAERMFEILPIQAQCEAATARPDVIEAWAKILVEFADE